MSEEAPKISEDALKGAITGSLGIILAIFQYFLNIFSNTIVSHPDWPSSFGSISILIGAFFAVFAAARWSALSQSARNVYFFASLTLMIASVFGCLLCRYKMEVTLFATRKEFMAVYYLWLCVFFVFGASFPLVLTD